MRYLIFFPAFLYVTQFIANNGTQADLQDLALDESSSDDEDSADDDLDPIAAERKRRSKKQSRLRRSAGEPQKPEVSEVLKLQESFNSMLRMVLAE